MKPYYEDDHATIYHGDCRELLPELGGVRFDIVLTDPPFSVPVKYHDTSGEYPRSWGDLTVMEPFFSDVFQKIKARLSDKGQVYVCCDGDSYPVFYKAAMPIWPRSHLLVWYKPSGRRGRGWLHSHELILHAYGVNAEHGDGFRQDVVGIMPVRTLNREHPAEKPGSLWSFLLEARAEGHTMVADPFMGSGEVLFQAKQVGMKSIGIEMEERYCEVAAQRLSQGVLDLGEAA